jgi:flagellum-specific ATP synthase
MGHYPAIDVLNSVSRLANRVAAAEQREAARRVREALAEYRQSEDLINLGAYAAGTNVRLDAAIRLRPQLLGFLRQEPEVNEPLARTLERLRGLAGQA